MKKFWIIPLIFFFVLGISESFAEEEEEETWYLGEGLQQGDYFSYELCHKDYHDCLVFQMDFWIEDNIQTKSENYWLAQAVVYDDGKIIQGDIHLGKNASEPIPPWDSNIAPYVKSFKVSVTELASFSSSLQPGNLVLNESFYAGKQLSSIGQPSIILDVTSKDILTIPPNAFETFVIGSNVFPQDKIWVQDDFPFPIKGQTWENEEKRYDFELLDYRKNIVEDPFSPVFIPQTNPNLEEKDESNSIKSGILPLNEKKEQLSLKQQIKQGILPKNITCNENKILILKVTDNSLMCVKHSTADKIIKRGIAKQVDPIAHTESTIISTGTFNFWDPIQSTTTITSDKIIFSETNRDLDESLPVQSMEAPISKQDWQKLIDSIDFDEFNSLPDQVGCPGCADNTVIWVEISNSTTTKKISFEPQDIIPEITELRTTLDEIIKK